RSRPGQSIAGLSKKDCSNGRSHECVMKKLLSISLICLFAFPAFSQERWTKKAPRRGADAREKHTIVSAYGAAFGLTYGKQIWDPEGPLAQERYMLSWNAAGLVEFFRHPH